jgi:hypothetical protein
MRNVLENLWVPSDLVVQALLAENARLVVASHGANSVGRRSVAPGMW